MADRQLAHYELKSPLGAGGMGEVWRAHDTKTGRDVALKLLPENLAGDSERLARFEREARTLASLNHPNIAALYGIEEADDQTFLVMELVEGEELGERIPAGGMPLADALEYARQLAEGLEEAHEKGIVHRDLKPANIKVTPEGRLKILDFGLARAFTGDGVGEGDAHMSQSPTITAAMTQAGTLLGTAAYMSPEQARGKPVDRRSDNWAFGAILWEMLTGRSLFEGETISDTLASVLKEPVPYEALAADLPRGVRRLLERCLERDPRKRLRDIGEARVRLEEWRDDPASMEQGGGQPGAHGVATRALARRWLAATAALALLAAAGWWLALGPAARSGPTQGYHIALSLASEPAPPLPGASLLISPDGTHVAYTSGVGIHVLRLDRAEERLLPGTAGASFLDFSPDGEWIAFLGNGELQRVRVGGGSPLPVARAAESRGLTWVDGETIVITRGVNNGLDRVSLLDGSVEPLTEVDRDAGERSHRWPTTAPGGSGVVFNCQFAGQDYDQGELRYVPLDGGPQQTVFRGGAFPRYAPGGQLLFARANAMYAIPWEPGDPEFRALAEPFLDRIWSSVGNQEVDDGSANFDASDTGTLVYRTEGSAGRESTISVLDLETGNVRALAAPALAQVPRLSPDGRRIAVSMVDEEGSPGIYVLDVEDGRAMRFNTERGLHNLSTWSPDGRWLYWTTGTGSGEWFVHRRASDGGTAQERVATLPGTVFLSSTDPTGRWLYGITWGGEDGWDLIRLDLEQEEPEPELVIGGPSLDVNPRVSPDGRWLAYETNTGSGTVRTRLRRLPDNGAVWDLDDGHVAAQGITWAADMSAIYLHDEGGIVRVPLSLGGDRVEIGRAESLEGRSFQTNPSFPTSDVAPDGSVAVVLQPVEVDGEAAGSRTMLMTNFRRELEAAASRR